MLPSYVDAKEIDVSRQQLLGIRWRRPVVATGDFRTVGVSFGSPAISENLYQGEPLVYVAQGEGRILALGLREGDERWRYQHRAPFETAVITYQIPPPNVAMGEIVLAAARDGELLALQGGTGKLLWQVSLGGECRVPPVVVDNVILLTTHNNQLLALDAISGETLWQRGRPEHTGLQVLGHAGVAVFDGNIYTSYSDGYVEAYRFDDGKLLWSKSISIGHHRFSDADATPVVRGDTIYVAAYGKGVVALDRYTGAQLWTVDQAAVTTLALYEDFVIAASADGQILGLSQVNGEQRYKISFTNAAISSLQVHDGLAAMGIGQQGLLLFDASNGKPQQLTPLGSDGVGMPAWRNREMVILSSSGILVRLRIGAPGLLQ